MSHKAPLASDGRAAVCAYCQRHLEPVGSRSTAAATIDHVTPKCEGGCETVWACFTCNNVKADMNPDEWARFRREHPFWWKTLARKPGWPIHR